MADHPAHKSISIHFQHMPQQISVNLHLQSVFESEKVNIHVGKPSNEFAVREGLFGHYSSHFRVALSSKSKEGLSKEPELVEDDAAVFKVFVHFLYCGTLHDPEHNINLEDGDFADCRPQTA